jgi:cation diffusion facilitator family transporter
MVFKKPRFSPAAWLQLASVVAIFTIVLKTWAWSLTGSVGMLSDALESGINLLSALFALTMFSIAKRPADDNHPYGHHKAEYFASGFEGLLIAGAAIAIACTAVQRWLNVQALEAVGAGLGLSALSTAINAALAYALWRVGKAHRSVALDAEAKHLMSDVWTSVSVGVGVLLCAATGWLWIDPLLALGVACYIFSTGAKLVWRSSQGLMDEALPVDVVRSLQSLLQGFEAQHVGQTVRFDHLDTRRAGQRCFADVHMHVPAHWTLGQAAQLRAEVEKALLEAVHGLHVNIQMLPWDTEPQAQCQPP